MSSSPAMAGDAVTEGAALSGCILERKLGQGGMGTVWAARDRDGAPVVVKLLLPEHARNAMWRERFAREGRLAAQVIHPNVARVHAVDIDGPSPPHIVMELVPGEDLADRLAREGRLPPLEAARLARDVARGLSAAHAVGVVHRDVKPGNVRVTPSGEVKLLDFGLARGFDVEDGVSIAGQVLGTPLYMPPEQWGDHRVDARADVYALGATLYHLVTGSPPFPGEHPMAICRRTLEGAFAPPRALAPDVPEELELVILRMMARDPRCRYESAAAAADELDAVLAGRAARVPVLREPSGLRHPLVPGTCFVLGGAPESDIVLKGLAPAHARVALTRGGFQLEDLGGGCSIGAARVQRVQLRSGDTLRLGEVELVFDAAGVLGDAVARTPDPARLRVRELPAVLVDALVEQRDRRVVVSLLELLPLGAIARQVASSREFVRRTFGDGALAEAVAHRLERLLRERRAWAIEALFRITHENLGDDEEGWLTWWEEAGASLPPQVAPFALRPRLRLRIEGDGPARVMDLGELALVRVGRGSDCQVQLDDPTISRHHACLLRLDRRVVVHDEGSRCGTRVGDAPVHAAFLEPGEGFALGPVRLTLDADDPHLAPPSEPDGSLRVDDALFEALAQQGHSSVVLALARAVQTVARGLHLRWVREAAANLHADERRARALADAVERALRARLVHPVRLLSGLVPDLVPSRAAQQVEQALGASLPVQVTPIGWPDAHR